MFWNKKGGGDKPQQTERPLTSDDPALDALGALIRTLGKYAFDLVDLDADTINQRCEEWARHILIATPYPGSRETFKGPSKLAERNWHGLREFVLQLRRQESTYVTRNFEGMRQVIGDVIQTLGNTFAEDQEDQVKIQAVLDRLKTAVEGNVPLETLRQEALQSINVISEIAEARNQRHVSIMDELAGKLKVMRTELDEARHEMELDPLTRIFNRKAFDQQLARIFDLNRLSGQAACLLMVDIDHFKEINDGYGHPAGDQVIKKFADSCVQIFPRKADFVSRYGGEEIAILLQDTPQEVGKMLGQRLLQAIQALRISHESHILKITVSIGVAELDPKTSATAWLQKADNALYRAKQAGRNRVEVA